MSTATESREESKGLDGDSAMKTDLESMINLSLLDPPRWGWAAIGGVEDLLPPHERARRKATRNSFKNLKRKTTKDARLGPTTKSTTTTSTTLKNSTIETQPSDNAAEVALPRAESNDSKQVLTPQQQNLPKDTTENSKEDPTKKMSAISNALDPCYEAKAVTYTTASFEKIINIGTKAKSTADTTANTTTNNSTSTGGAKSSKGRGKSTAPSNKNKNSNAAQQSDQVESNVDKDDGAENNRDGDTTTSTKVVGTSKPNGTNIEKMEVIQLSVHSTKNDILDMYTYHRGREGLEARNVETGELLCDVEPTDTNHDWDSPKLVATIAIEFPLDGSDGLTTTTTKSKRLKNTKNNHMDDNMKKNGKAKNGDNDVAQYRDSVSWDLSDPTNPTPLQFATNVGQEFGLTFGQTMDLAMSIQQQLDTHVLQNCAYCVPMPLKDLAGNDRRIALQPTYTCRYGSVLEAERGGMKMTRKEQQNAMSQHRSSKGSTTASSAFSSRQFPTPTTASSVVLSQSSSAPRRKSLESSNSQDGLACYEEGEKVEKKFRDEVQRRIKEAFIQDQLEKKNNAAMSSPLEIQPNHHCHICHKRCNFCVVFICGIPSHAFCQVHCKSKLDLIVDEHNSGTLNFCPICCLSCNCSKCKRNLEAAARIFKAECQEQGKKPSDAIFEDVLTTFTTGPMAPRPAKRRPEVVEVQEEPAMGKKAAKRRKQQSTGSTGGFSDGRYRPMVPKPPLSDLPREVCGMREVEPGTPRDYMTIYTANGNFIYETHPEYGLFKETSSSNKASDGSVSDEDGNVDYCHVCQKYGNLLCCDTCPRAFHIDCIQHKVQATDGTWQCYVCREEIAGLAADLVDGGKSMDLICASFLNCPMGTDPSDHESFKSIQVLSMIHAMVQELMKYEFGYMFREPVDCDRVIGYRDLVSNPMDLGTIGSKLINGGYVEKLQLRNSWDDVIVAVLNDIELVWHNCCTFNREGSAIYRMATVHQRRSQNIRRRSFEHLLSEWVKTKTAEYVKHCERQRGEFSSTSSGVRLNKEESFLATRPRSKHKITVKTTKGGCTRPVAVLDPVKGRVVKVYSSIKSAGQAALFILGLGYKCEWDNLNDIFVKSIVHRSTSDSSVLLFGYRWLLLEDLRREKIKFSNMSADLIEMCYDGSTYLFLSVEEALSFAELPEHLSVEELRKVLTSLPSGGTWKTVGTLNWRRPLPAESGQDENQGSDQKLDNTLSEKGTVSNDSLHRPAKHPNKGFPNNDSYFSQKCIVTKEDLVTGRTLLGFESLEVAYRDWVVTCECSPTFPGKERNSLQNFRSFYLDGDRNVDGVVWKTFNGPSSRGHCGSQIVQTRTVENAELNESNTCTLDGPTAFDDRSQHLPENNTDAKIESHNAAQASSLSGVGNGFGFEKTGQGPTFVQQRYVHMEGAGH